MTIINLTTLKNEDTFSPEYRKLEFRSDVQLYDTWEDEELTDYNYTISANSVTELYSKLYDVSQSNDCFPRGAKILLEGEKFAEMVGYHLKLNEEFPIEKLEKYMTKTEIDFVTSDVLRKTYSSDEKVDGITLYRDDDYKAYRNSEAGNHIRCEDGKKVFETKEDVLKVLNYYLKGDSNSACINGLDETTVKLDGEEVLTLKFGKEVKIQETPNVTIKNRTRRKM